MNSETQSNQILDANLTLPLVSKPLVSKRKRRRTFVFFVGVGIIAICCFLFLNRRGVMKVARYAPTAARGVLPTGIKRTTPRDTIAKKIVAASHAQIGTSYDPAYVLISYPGGDVDKSKGVCTDVVVRALRGAGLDLQKLMHEDMVRNFRKYPQKWGLPKPDKNIDHRRVPNQMTFFARKGESLSTRVTESTLKSWQPGDIVCWDMQNGQLHTGVISDGISSAGVPLVIHNGWICMEDDSLSRWKIIGHFRYPKRRT